jgi:hypothetical protein
MVKTVVTALVVVHLVATLWHGDAHSTLEIDLPLLKDVFVYAVILAGPLLAAALVWTRHQDAALWIFCAAMLGALLFGAYHHYVLVSPDNIHHLPAGTPHEHASFVQSAAAIALLELGALLYGTYQLGLRSSGR